jgi:hypothetical protein
MSENGRAISEATPIRIGLVILFLGVFGSGVWWASSVNSKLDSIMANQGAVVIALSEEKIELAASVKNIGDLTLRVAILESKQADPQKK